MDQSSGRELVDQNSERELQNGCSDTVVPRGTGPVFLAPGREKDETTKAMRRQVSGPSHSEEEEHPSEANAVVQFASPVSFCEENEGYVTLFVDRIGDQSGLSEVSYTTEDVTAQAGVRYKASTGTIIFAPGETQKEIQVPITNSTVWQSTLEFKVVLLHDGLVNAILGRKLWRTRVKILDQDTFPSSLFKDEMLADKLDEVPKMDLLREYCTLCWNDPVVRQGTIKWVLADQLINLNMVLGLLINIYLVDVVFHHHEAGTAVSKMFGFSFMFLLFFLRFKKTILFYVFIFFLRFIVFFYVFIVFILFSNILKNNDKDLKF